MEVFVVYWFMEYEGENLLAVFSDYVKAREYQLSQNDENVYIRKVELDSGNSGEEI